MTRVRVGRGKRKEEGRGMMAGNGVGVEGGMIVGRGIGSGMVVGKDIGSGVPVGTGIGKGGGEMIGMTMMMRSVGLSIGGEMIGGDLFGKSKAGTVVL